MKKVLIVLTASAVCGLVGCQSVPTIPQSNAGGQAADYGGWELPEHIVPNDATISLYQEKRLQLISIRRRWGRLYKIPPKGNAESFTTTTTPLSAAVERELSSGYLFSYLFYDNGELKYNGKASAGRFSRDIDDEMLFYSHSTGKSITSYIIGHAICDGYISSADEPLDWPLMSKTLYQGQPLRNLLNMNAGDGHTVNERANRVIGTNTHHRDLGLDTIAAALEGTQKRGEAVRYNNVLTDILANYVVYKAGSNYDSLMREVFQNKVKIKYEVAYERHANTLTNGKQSPYFGQLQTSASYSYYMTRLDFLRVAIAMMRDYQNKSCVGEYLRDLQKKAVAWPKYRPYENNSWKWLHRYAKSYGGQFYLNFEGMSDRNIFATEGYNGQNMMIDMDKSRIVVTNSAATAWSQKIFMLDVIRNGALPK